MKQIILKEMSLVNFKGVRKADYSFNADVTSFAGKNGTGKTTIFDAFTWLLFGKDSLDRKQFQLKTIDNATHEVIPKLPHEVTAVISVEGVDVRLTRRYNEKWVKPRGSMEEKFEGHTEERLYNDVPCSTKEWAEKIGAICDETLFKLITNPTYFVSLHPKDQRSMLLEFADADSVAVSGDEFNELLTILSSENKTLDEYKRELNAKRAKTTSEVDAIPGRIDERQREIASLTCDFDAAEKELAEKQDQFGKLTEMVEDASAVLNAGIEQRTKLMDRLDELTGKLNARKIQVSKEARADFDAYMAERWRVESKIKFNEKELADLAEKRKSIESRLDKCSADREQLVKEWYEINERQCPSLDKNAMSCPTCGRVYDLDTITEKEDAMRERFNEKKASDLRANNTKGMDLKEKMHELTDTLDAMDEDKKRLNTRLEELRNELEGYPMKEEPDVEGAVKADAEMHNLQGEIDQVKAQIEESKKGDNAMELTDIKIKRSGLQGEIDALKHILSKRDDIKRNEKRIDELQRTLRELYNVRAGVEHGLWMIKEYENARVKAVEDKINGMFEYVTFKMFARQINGEVVETCEAEVNGVPYSVLNNAARINAGLEIIRVISAKRGITAPIFVDNAESVIELISTGGQQIRLYVANCPFKQLTEPFYN